MPLPGGAPERSEGVTLLGLAGLFPDEQAARGWFEEQIWPDGRRCPRCGGGAHLCCVSPDDAVLVCRLPKLLLGEDRHTDGSVESAAADVGVHDLPGSRLAAGRLAGEATPGYRGVSGDRLVHVGEDRGRAPRPPARRPHGLRRAVPTGSPRSQPSVLGGT